MVTNDNDGPGGDVDLIRRLRGATEDHVGQALLDAYVSLPLTSRAAALEFYNRMLDVILGAEVDQAE